MTEDYVSFETAKMLKEKGFPLPSTNFEDWVFCMYDENGDIQWGCYHPDYYCRVTLQMAMKWLLKKHNIFICILFMEDLNRFGYTIEDIVKKKIIGSSGDSSYKEPEESDDAAIKYCLENLI